jgi:hypothetical protein
MAPAGAPASPPSHAPLAPGLPESPRESPGWRGRRGLLGLLGGMAAWGGWFIFRTSFLSDGRRVFCLFDDAMISMTYARNLVEGHGLNWARFGQPVEGFTHPLWTALMVPVNLLPIGLERRSLVVQLGSLALLMLHVVLVRRLMLRHFSFPGARHWGPAGVLTAFYYPLGYWALMGLETGLQAVLTTALVLLALDIVHGRRDRHLALLVVGTLAVLLRLDMALPVVATQVYVLAHGGLRRRGGETTRRPWLVHWLSGVAVLAAAVGGYGVFRWVYFHDLLPNTYYLKLGGVPLAVRLLRGGSVMLDTLRAQGPLLVAVGIGVAASWPPREPGEAPEGRDDRLDSHGDRELGRRLLLPLAVLALACAYSVYVGGDAWEGKEVRANRFVAFAMPQLFVAFNALLNQALSALSARARRPRPRLRAAAAAALAEARGEPEGRGESGEPDAEPGAGLAGAHDRESAHAPGGMRAGSPALPRLALPVATCAALLVSNGLWPAGAEGAVSSWRNFLSMSRPLAVSDHANVLDRVRALQRIAEPPAAVAVIWAGIPAYFSDFRMIDKLGYNDRHLAHGRPTVELSEDHFEAFWPGHVKGDVAYVIEVERPDAFLQALRSEAPRLLARGYRMVDGFWIDPKSPWIHAPPHDHAPPAEGPAGRQGGSGAAPIHARRDTGPDAPR